MRAIRIPLLARLTKAKLTVSTLVAMVFFAITLLASILIYGAYLQQRDAVITKVGRIEAQQTAGLIFEHLYSVMRKGWTRAEIDEVIHHIGQRLPDYEIDVVRGEPVARQYGELAGDPQKRRLDPLVAAVISEGKDVFLRSDELLRYGFAVRMKSECMVCHAEASIGDVNGVIIVGIPSARLRQPIESAIMPISALAGLVVLVLFGAIFLALRVRVVKPVQEFARRVSQTSENRADTRIKPQPHWPLEILSLASDFNSMMDHIQQDQKLLEESSLLDPLTGLHNRRHFDAVLARAKADADAGADPFSVLLIDLDRFKPINDTHGHAAGDAVLIAVANAIRSALREADLPARIGGDEFAVIVMATDENGSGEVKERIRHAVSSIRLRFGHHVIEPSCSIGIASYHAGIGNEAELLHSADAAMYADKAARKAQR